MSDDFAGHNQTLDAPCANGLAITASGSALAKTTRALYIGGAGSITVTMNGQSVTFANVGVGILPIRVTHLTAATATGIVALW